MASRSSYLLGVSWVRHPADQALPALRGGRKYAELRDLIRSPRRRALGQGPLENPGLRLGQLPNAPWACRLGQQHRQGLVWPSLPATFMCSTEVPSS